MKPHTRIIYFAIVFLVIIITKTGNGQEVKPIETLFDHKIERISGFGGTVKSFTRIDNHFSFFMGAEGGLIFNNKLSVGGYFLKLISNIESETSSCIGCDTELSLRGVLVRYSAKPEWTVHPAVSLYTGWGSLNILEQSTEIYDNIFAVTPVIQLESNITRFFRAGIGMNYVFALGIDEVDGYANKDFSYSGVIITLLFGWF